MESPNVYFQKNYVSRSRRSKVLGQSRFIGCTVWFTGLSGAGKTSISFALEEYLCLRRIPSYALDGDNIRSGLNKNLGFSIQDCEENIRRVGEVAKLFADAGFVCLSSFISPFSKDRWKVRQLHENAGLPFFECYVSTPLEVCEKRDVKGLYKRAHAGFVDDLVDLKSIYEPPINPDIVLNAGTLTLEECLQALVKMLEKKILFLLVQ